MNKILLLTAFALGFFVRARSQDISAKERAEAIAKNDFSKAKYKRKEKYGVVKEKNKVIESTPVIDNNPSFYQGNYVCEGLDYQLEIRQDPQKQWLVTFTTDRKKTVLRKVSIRDAYFSATKQAENATEEVWEGTFINKSDNGEVAFGLGIKLSTAVTQEGLQTNKLFFKKVSP